MTPAKRGKGRGKDEKATLTKEPPTSAEWRASMRWAQRLKRVFDIEICPACGGAVKVIACIEDPVVIRTILDHLDKQDKPRETGILPEPRAPPISHHVTPLPGADKT